jgi:hypothetical protein
MRQEIDSIFAFHSLRANGIDQRSAINFDRPTFDRGTQAYQDDSALLYMFIHSNSRLDDLLIGQTIRLYQYEELRP